MAEETQTQSSSSGGTATTSQSASQSGSTSQGSQAGTTTQTQQTQSQSQAPARPEYVPEAHWDPASGKVRDDKALSAHFNEIISRDAAEQIRRNSLPQAPDAYKVELPVDFKPPEGVTFQFKDGDPLLAQARTMAHEMGLGQEQFSRLLGLYAGSQVASQQAIANARNAEIAKLGTAGPTRITALETFFKAQLGDAEGAQIMSRVFTASDVQTMEKLVSKFTGQGTGGFSTRGREAPGQPGKLSDADFAKLTPAQKLDYARSHNQSQFQSPGRAA